MPDYNEESILFALQDINNGLSQRKAAALYKIPRSTLQERLNGRQTHSQGAEGLQRLTKWQESHLTKWVLVQDALALPPTHLQLKQFASRLLIQAGDLEPLGKHWISGFLARNPEISTTRGKRLDSKRINGASTYAIKDFFALQQILAIKSIAPQHRYNMDETGVLEGIGDNGLVLGAAEKNSTLRKQAGSRSWTTILECVSALGVALDPLIVFKGKAIQHQWFPEELEFLQKWHFTTSDKGWTEDAIALKWLKEIFIPSTQPSARTPKAMRLLIMDGHKSHETDDFMWECYKNNIYLLFLPPHSSHVLQPLNLSVFSVIKRAYRRELAVYIEGAETTPIGKITFLKCYSRARDDGLTVKNIKGGWKAAGLWPINMAKPLMNPYVITGTRSPAAAISTINTPSEMPVTVFNTPQASQEFKAMCSSIVLSNTSDTTIRLLFRKAANGFDNHNAKLVEAELKIQRLESQIERLQPTKRRKVKESANEKFVRIVDIIAVKATLPVQPDPRSSSPEGSITLDSICVAIAR